MVRARLATLALASSLLAVSGCFSLADSHCSTAHPSGCECNAYDNYDVAGGISSFEGPVLAPPLDNAFPPPYTAPPYPPPGSPTAPPPRIVPVPQANPMPYSPTGFRKLFWREP